MTTAVSNHEPFKPGDRVEMVFITPSGPARIVVTIRDEIMHGFYQVEDQSGQQLLMHAASDNPTRITSVEDTHQMPVVVPKAPIPEPVAKDPVEFGMSSPDLAVEVANVINALSDRVLGPGKEQYEHTDANGVTYQNFETMDLPTLVLYAREEIQDIIVYVVMLDIRLRRVQAAFKAKLPPTES